MTAGILYLPLTRICCQQSAELMAAMILSDVLLVSNTCSLACAQLRCLLTAAYTAT